jgi:hypothetical protein
MASDLPSERKPVNIFGTATKAPSAMPTGPKGPTFAFKGATLREQISLSFNDLKAKFPNLSDGQIVKVVEMVRATNVQSGKYEGLSDWGIAIQKQFSNALDRELTLLQTGLLEEAKQEIATIISRLESFNDIVSAKTATLKDKLFGFFANPKADFENRYIELKKVVASLDNKLPGLKALRAEVQTQQKDAKFIEDSLAVHLAGAACIIEYINNHLEVTGPQPAIGSQVQLMEARVLSLTTSQATVITSNTQRDLIALTINRIIEVVQDVLLVELPAWRANYIAILALDASDANYSQKLQEFAGKQTQLLVKLKV